MTGCIVFPMKNPKMNAANMTRYAVLSRLAKKSFLGSGGGGGGAIMACGK